MKWTVKEVAQAKGYDNATQLGEAAGIPLTSMYRIWNGTAKMVGTDTLERLCKVLQVQPGMLIMFIDTDAIQQGEAAQKAPEAKPRRSAPSKKNKARGAGARAAALR